MNANSIIDLAFGRLAGDAARLGEQNLQRFLSLVLSWVMLLKSQVQ